MSPLAQAAVREVEDLHQVFTELFTGRLQTTARLAQVFDCAFEMVTPGGMRLDREAVLAALASTKAGPDFRISILSARPLWRDDDSILLQYVEQQYRDGRMTRRLSSALFRAEPTAPNGVVWRYLHETWMQDAE